MLASAQLYSTTSHLIVLYVSKCGSVLGRWYILLVGSSGMSDVLEQEQA